MPKTKKPTRKQFEAVLNERVTKMTMPHLRCRDLGHVWREFSPPTLNDDAAAWRRALKCEKKHGGCGAQRIEYIDTTGGISSRRYNYPDGYQMKGIGIVGGISKAYFRKEYLERLAN